MYVLSSSHYVAACVAQPLYPLRAFAHHATFTVLLRLLSYLPSASLRSYHLVLSVLHATQ